jgi:hypothetical protein
MRRLNVYNSVKVTLSNQEFGKISQNELQVAKFLDLLHTIRIPKETEEDYISFEQIMAISEVDHPIESIRNNQREATPLFGERIEALRLTQG